MAFRYDGGLRAVLLWSLMYGCAARLLSRNRFNLFSLSDRDYGAGGRVCDSTGRAAWLRRMGVGGSGIEGPEAAEPLLLTQPKMLGIWFQSGQLLVFSGSWRRSALR